MMTNTEVALAMLRDVCATDPGMRDSLVWHLADVHDKAARIRDESAKAGLDALTAEAACAVTAISALITILREAAK